jgi:hypothetical protein
VTLYLEASQVGVQAVLGAWEQYPVRKPSAGQVSNMMEPFPERPKGMHLDTYMRLYWECQEAEMEHLVGVREWLDKLQKQIA